MCSSLRNSPLYILYFTLSIQNMAIEVQMQVQINKHAWKTTIQQKRIYIYMQSRESTLFKQ